MQEAIVDFERALLMWWNNPANCVIAEQCIDTATIHLISRFGRVSRPVTDITDRFITAIPESDLPKSDGIEASLLPSVLCDLKK
jgi:hypothetical protein